MHLMLSWVWACVPLLHACCIFGWKVTADLAESLGA